MAETERKSIKLTGGAAADYASQLGAGSRKRGASRKKSRQSGGQQSGGAGLSSAEAIVHRPSNLVLKEATGTIPPVLKGGFDDPPGSRNPITTRNMTAMVDAAKAHPVLPAAKGGATGQTAQTTQTTQTAQKAKVILSPSKKSSSKRLILAPPKEKQKGTRKIRVALHGMRKRMTRAKKIHHESKEKPLAELHRALVEAKLLKESSKIPEPLLRSMYKDFVLLKERAL